LERFTVRRFPRRGRYDRRTIDAILDCGIVCHVGFVRDGHPVVIPTLYWREGDRLYWHASIRGRMVRAIAGAPVCVAVTHLDGLVCARSAFNHSANYRSVVLFGTAVAVTDPAQKKLRMKAMMESICPDRWELLRPVTDKEVNATAILSLAIDQASAKFRDGPPGDAEDSGWPVWAGVIPTSTVVGEPEREGEGGGSLEAPRTLRPS
jgi:nitroimidazol reductase NimA-like FMN-containing flavoprotein (pyridoxamine 5'-phosphate oxidase superfamily)